MEREGGRDLLLVHTSDGYHSLGQARMKLRTGSSIWVCLTWVAENQAFGHLLKLPQLHQPGAASEVIPKWDANICSRQLHPLCHDASLHIFLTYILICLKDRRKERKHLCSHVGSLLKCPKQPGLGWVKARGWSSTSLSCGCLGSIIGCLLQCVLARNWCWEQTQDLNSGTLQGGSMVILLCGSPARTSGHLLPLYQSYVVFLFCLFSFLIFFFSFQNRPTVTFLVVLDF